ncbi:MAG: four helix bundle protein [Thermomicrobiales bacterium]|nr:MAG: four helix bundle protein [Thermomicrobiales bacterium]
MAVRRKQRAFKELKVWQKAHSLTLEAYRVTASFPREELFGLTSQVRRAASSIPANIAEGCGRGGGDLARFCELAAGSASELEYHLILARDLGYLDLATYDHLASQVEEGRANARRLHRQLVFVR